MLVSRMWLSIDREEGASRHPDLKEELYMALYETPTITELGSVQDLTLMPIIHKNAGSGDVIVIAGQAPDPVPGNGLS